MNQRPNIPDLTGLTQFPNPVVSGGGDGANMRPPSPQRASLSPPSTPMSSMPLFASHFQNPYSYGGGNGANMPPSSPQSSAPVPGDSYRGKGAGLPPLGPRGSILPVSLYSQNLLSYGRRKTGKRGRPPIYPRIPLSTFSPSSYIPMISQPMVPTLSGPLSSKPQPSKVFSFEDLMSSSTSPSTPVDNRLSLPPTPSLYSDMEKVSGSSEPPRSGNKRANTDDPMITQNSPQIIIGDRNATDHHLLSADTTKSKKLKINSLGEIVHRDRLTNSEMKKIENEPELQEMALSHPKKVRTMLKNRESSKRSKERQAQYVIDLENHFKALQITVDKLSSEVQITKTKRDGMMNTKTILMNRVEEMDKVLKRSEMLGEFYTSEIERLRKKMAAMEIHQLNQSEIPNMDTEMFQQLNTDQFNHQPPINPGSQ